MKKSWKPVLSITAYCMWLCVGTSQNADALPYTFNESSANAQGSSGGGRNQSASVAPMESLALPPALRAIDEANVPQYAPANAASTSSFMTEDISNARRRLRNGGSQGNNTPTYYSSASQQGSMPFEQWSGNRRSGNRQRNMQYGSGNNSDFKNSNPTSFNFGTGNFNRFYADSGNDNKHGSDNSYNNGSRNKVSRAYGDGSFGSNQNNFNSGNNNNNNSSADPAFRKPDKFADNPEVDSNGVRHFANGKHFDLSKTPLSQAIDSTNASQLGGNPERRNKLTGNPPDLSAQLMSNNNFGAYRRMPYQAPDEQVLQQYVNQQRLNRNALARNNRNGTGRYIDYLRVQP